jgi:hypothetical protein
MSTISFYAAIAGCDRINMAFRQIDMVVKLD